MRHHSIHNLALSYNNPTQPVYSFQTLLTANSPLGEMDRPTPTSFFTPQPSSQIPSFEQRQNTIPPPPYPLQAPLPSQTFFNNDVFLARKREQNQQNYEKQQLEIDRPGQANARETSYAAAQAIDAMSKAIDEVEGLRTWEGREDRRMDRYGSQAIEGTKGSIPSTAAMVFVCPLHLHHALLPLARSIFPVWSFSTTPPAPYRTRPCA